MKCPKCGQDFHPVDLQAGESLSTDRGPEIEITAECSSNECDQRFYTFVSLDWEPLED